ncbi:nitrate reductase [Candidatus Tenderia electrophaga]|jgi:assimilatory nitrate reductase catalytic subunit|uniref:nitrate reductase (cytochrome) n=1 Tax=Candidatus Tenderia electrophaga TaxID=1748243 RepID=A0A0S2TF57_9GAMM|nr:nitrate reductase [Candidatus Tenderia electrophaga]
MNNTTQTTCPYCGVGCGVLATPNDASVAIAGDTRHPANFGRLCSKGASLGQTVDLDQRLLYPEVHGRRSDWDTALNTVADGFKRIVAEHGPDAVAMYVSGQLLTEDYYCANKLMKGYIGSANIDTNSRLCMSSSVAGHKRAFGADSVPCSYEDLERAKLIVLVGSNTAWCHPVLYQRMVQAKQDNPDLQIIVIDPRKTATCDLADLHLPLRPGSDAILFNGLLAHLNRVGETNELFVGNFTSGHEVALAAARDGAGSLETVAQACGLPPQDVAEFYRLFARTERVISVYSQGINQSSSGTDKVNAIINCHLLTGRIGRPGMGPFSFTGQPNAMGGREVGGLANMLAAHMDIDNAEHRRLVQGFWQSPRIADHQGLKAVDLFNAIDAGKVKAVWIMATNPVVSMPDADRVKAALQKCELVVVSDIMCETDTTALAHVLLPALGWGEKDGTVTNSERRISRQRAFLPPPGEAKADWWMIAEVGKRMGFDRAFDYGSATDIFREHAALSGHGNDGRRDFDIAELSKLSDADYESLAPIQWPVVNGAGKARMFGDGRFFTPDGRARLLAIEPRPPEHSPSDDFPLSLNTGRVRDQWHTMTRTGKAPRLSEHSPEPYVEIHPYDAKEAAVSEGALARVFSRWGEVIVRVKLSEDQQRGSVFVPMHWNDQFASHARVDAVVNPVVDPISGQPESKQTPVRVAAYRPAWHGFLLSRRRLKMTGLAYWSRASGNGFYRYEIAGEQTEGDWPAWARELLCDSDSKVNWVEYLDARAHQYRAVRMVGRQVESCVFTAPGHELPSRSWLAGLFAKDVLTDAEHSGLLLGKPPVGQEDVGRVVCACFSVGINSISTAIKAQNLCSAEEIGAVLKAGTNCGSCVPELKRLLAAGTEDAS